MSDGSLPLVTPDLGVESRSSFSASFSPPQELRHVTHELVREFGERLMSAPKRGDSCSIEQPSGPPTVDPPGQDRISGSPDQQDGCIDALRICPCIVIGIGEAPPDPSERPNSGGVAGRDDGSRPDGFDLGCPSAEVEAGEHSHCHRCDPLRSEQSTRQERCRPSGSESSWVHEDEGPNEIRSSSGSAQGGETTDRVPDEGERSLPDLLEDPGKELRESTRARIIDRVARAVSRPVESMNSCMAT